MIKDISRWRISTSQWENTFAQKWAKDLNRHFTKRSPNGQKLMRRDSASLALREMQIKSIVRYSAHRENGILKKQKQNRPQTTGQQQVFQGHRMARTLHPKAGGSHRTAVLLKCLAMSVKTYHTLKQRESTSAHQKQNCKRMFMCWWWALKGNNPNSH